MWGENVEPDIDVYRIVEELEPGNFESVLCEGCDLRAVGKSQDGNAMVAMLKEPGHVEDLVSWLQISEWENLPKTV